MIAEAIDKVIGLTNKNRPAILKVDDGSKRQFMYDDATSKYVEMPRVVIQTGSVSNIESFAALVEEELIRRGNLSGEFATVTFTSTGGRFSPDDRSRLDTFMYDRAIAPAWRRLSDAAREGFLSHRTFLNLIQYLKPYMEDPAKIRDFKKVTFDEKTKIVSQPVLIDGKTESVYQIEVEVKSGIARTTLPSSLHFNIPYAKGSNAWVVETDIDITVNENNGKRAVSFAILWPDVASQEENAVSSEVEFFREKLATYKRLLVLEDY